MKKKTRNQKDSEPKWIYVLWVPWRSLLEREKEREYNHNTETKKRKEKKKICMHEHVT